MFVKNDTYAATSIEQICANKINDFQSFTKHLGNLCKKCISNLFQEQKFWAKITKKLLYMYMKKQT